LPNVRSPTIFARPFFWSAPARISLAEADEPLTSTASGTDRAHSWPFSRVM
jgi:hypothetical protein